MRIEKLPDISQNESGQVCDMKYKAVVFDLDGTLYNQTKLRINMAFRLMIYYVCHVFRIKELFVLKYFREVRDKWDVLYTQEMRGNTVDEKDANGKASSEKSVDGKSVDGKSVDSKSVDGKSVDGKSLDELQYEYVSRHKHVDTAYVERVVKKWIYDNPLDLLKKFRNEELYSYIMSLKSLSIPVIIFSDYPIEDKIAALNISPDGMYFPGDERNIELKPSPMGINLILNDFALDKDEILMVGDRDAKDGESARLAGVDYLIL